MGLDELKKLRVLDVTNNQIDMSLKDVYWKFQRNFLCLACFVFRPYEYFRMYCFKRKLLYEV